LVSESRIMLQPCFQLHVIEEPLQVKTRSGAGSFRTLQISLGFKQLAQPLHVERRGPAADGLGRPSSLAAAAIIGISW
jgi:hypothetical protein